MAPTQETDAVAHNGYTATRVVRTYVVTNALFTLSTSLIWSVNTLFLLQAGVSLPMVFVVNATFTAAQMVFEVPTGVVADTLGRKVSFMLGIATLAVSTVVYVLSAQMGWGVPGFIVGSVLIGLGFTFQTGAVDAWMVDAYTSVTGARMGDDALSRVFALSGGVSGAVLVVGPLAGGLLGQVSLYLPYYVRAVALVATFVVVAVMMREVGFERRALTVGSFASETRAIADAGIRYGWRSRVVRPLLWVSLVQGLFFAYGFYALSPYLLQLVGKDLVWLTGVVFSAFSLASILGNLSIRWGIMRRRDGSARSAPATLAVVAVVVALLIAGIGVAGLGSRGGVSLVGFIAVAALWTLVGYFFGLSGPVASGYINQHIPSEQRATVLSVSALFGDAGAVVGQPALGYAAQATSIAATWIVGGVVMLAAAPLYRASARAARREVPAGSEHAQAAAGVELGELSPETMPGVRPEEHCE